MGDDDRVFRPSFTTIKEAIVKNGWSRPPHWVPDWPDPPPISVWLQIEPVSFTDATRSATSGQPQSGWFDSGGVYSGGLAQVMWHQTQGVVGSGEEVNLVLQTSPVRDPAYFVDVATLASITSTGGVTAGEVDST